MINVELVPEISLMQKEWRNDPSVRIFTRSMAETTDEEHALWLTSDASEEFFGVKYLGGSTDKDAVYNEVIGTVGLSKVDHRNKSAEFSILINPRLHGKGFGEAALHAILNYGFDVLDLNKIYGETLAGNPALMLFIKSGMQSEGFLREHYCGPKGFRDSFIVSMLRSEWREKPWSTPSA